MSTNTIGSRIVLEGEKEYRQALQNINTEQKNLRSEMKLCASEFEGQQNSLDALTKKHEILGRQIESQNNKIQLYTQQLEESQKAHEAAGNKIDSLKEQLQAANKEMDAMKASSKTSAEALEEQQKKIDSLNQQLEGAGKEYNKTEQAAVKWQTQINNASADLNSMNSDLRNTEKYMEEARKSTNGCASSIDEYGKAIKQSTEDSNTFGAVLKANLASEAIVGGFNKIISLAKEAGEELLNCAMDAFAYADNIATMSTNTGIAAETLQELTYAEELMDVSLNTVTSSMVKNIKSMDSAREGSASYVEAYEKLGVSVADANGQLRDSETVYWEVIDALGAIKNETERDAVSMTIFGKKAQDLNSLIAIGSKGFRELAGEAKSTGFVMSDDMLGALLENSDAFERMKNRATAVKNNIGAELAPTLTVAFDEIGDKLEDVQDDVVDFAEDAIPLLVNGLEWIIDNGDVILSLMAGITTATIYHSTVAPMIVGVTEAWNKYKTANEAAAVAQGTLNVAMEANPAGLLVTAIVGLTAAVATFVLTTANAESEADKLVQKSREAVDTLSQETQNRKEATAANEAEMNTIRNLTQELSKLDNKEKLSTEEKSRMLLVVDELNQAMPELNLSINEQTGHLNENSRGWEKDAEAMMAAMELQFKQEELTAIAKERYEAEKKLTEIQETRAELEAELGEAVDNYNVWGAALDDTSESAFQTEMHMRDLSQAVEEQKGLEEELNAQMKSLDEEYTALYDSMSGVNEKTFESCEMMVEYGDKMLTVQVNSEETRNAIESLSEEYANAKEAATESIESQVGLFEELSTASDLSIGQMSQNLQSQTDAFTQYKDDILRCSELVEQGILDEGLLGSIQALGMDGAGYMHELATASDEDIGKVVESFGEMQEAKDHLASAIADINTEYTDRMDELLGIQTEKMDLYKNTAEESNEEVGEIMKAGSEETVNTATDTMDSFNDEIKKGTVVVTDSMEKLCDSVILATNTKMNIVEGKSLVFQEIGRTLPAGLAQGINDGTSEVEAAISNLVDKMIAKAIAKIKEAKKSIDRALGDALR